MKKTGEISPATLKKMSALALKARKNAYAPYSNHPVGAAVLTARGNIYAGANSESANFRSVCAELAAIVAMTSAGEREIRAVVTVAPDGGSFCTPCGACRQNIREFAGAGTRVYALYDDGRLAKSYTMDDLLPDSFGPENLAALGFGPALKKARRGKK